MSKYIIFGAGAFISDVFDLIHAANGTVYKIYQNIQEVKREGELGLKKRVSLMDYEISVFDSLDYFKPENNCKYVVGCITVKKFRLIEYLKMDYGISFTSLVHPRAHLGSNIHIGEGVFISPGTVIAPNTYLDDFCSVNRGVSIGHDVYIGRYTRIGPSVSLAGGTHIGEKCNIGIGACVIDHLKVGNWSVIGAGSVVTRDVPEKVIAYGVPAKIIRKKEKDEFQENTPEKKN